MSSVTVWSDSWRKEGSSSVMARITIWRWNPHYGYLPTRASLHNYTQSKDELKDPISAVVVQTRDADGNVLMDEVVDRDRVQEATEKQ
jgi:hypothetical protein